MSRRESSTDFTRLAQYPGSGCEKYDRRGEIFGRDDVIPLWVADMDFPAPDFVNEALAERLADGAFGYAKPDAGHFDAITGWLAGQHDWQVAPETIVPVPGVVPAMAMAIRAFTRLDARVIIQPPVYFPFFQVVRDQGRTLVENPLVERPDGSGGTRYEMNFEALEAEAAEAEMLLLCNPHNPGGRAWSTDELRQVATICARHDVMVISDEIHMDLTYPGVSHTPFARVGDPSGCRWFTVTAPGKTFNTAGIGGGYAVIPDAAIRERFDRERRGMHLGEGSVFGLTALKAAYVHGSHWPDELMAHVAINRDRVVEAVSDLPIEPMWPEATYLLWLDCRGMGLSDATSDPEDRALQRFFIEEAGLGLSQGIIFGEPGRGYMRINLASPTRVIDRAMAQLREAWAIRVDDRG
ncbi:PatB family C-S lyase [Guyparkeria hydrothermalis]|uniref:MalY/PatB family protein n=1 Tax=Guyparkeria hydrothermalis TaxID=923 RepID=UPI0020221548|nr:PatB family C-S lyase [Guyparkeria hydrothermalis]MCL7743393.1 PatB family C-S lyase [Guyparkeria hydrothermalis]